MFAHELPEVFSARDVARAAGVAESDVHALIHAGEIRTIGALLPGSVEARSRHYIPQAEAVRIVRAFRSGNTIARIEGGDFNRLLAPLPVRKRPTTVPMLVSTSLHGLVAAAVVVITSIGFTNADERTDVIDEAKPPIRMVYLMQPGPGGGGGGGGLKMRTPPTKVERKGEKKISSPLPARKIPPPLEPKPTPVEPPPTPLEAKVLPPVMAPSHRLRPTRATARARSRKRRRKHLRARGRAAGVAPVSAKARAWARATGLALAQARAAALAAGRIAREAVSSRRVFSRKCAPSIPTRHGARTSLAKSCSKLSCAETAAWATSRFCSGSARVWISARSTPCVNGGSRRLG